MEYFTDYSFFKANLYFAQMYYIYINYYMVSSLCAEKKESAPKTELVIGTRKIPHRNSREKDEDFLLEVMQELRRDYLKKHCKLPPDNKEETKNK
ncbi:hypothetical protein NUSPORA_01047 [Nucleospora cyclopteri]